MVVPRWIKVAAAGAFAFVLLTTLLSMDWHARRVVAEFAEQFVAVLLRFGAPLGAGIAGIAAGISAAARSRSNLLGCVAGAAVFLAIGLAVLWVAHRVPGVGWRVDRMMNAD